MMENVASIQCCQLSAPISNGGWERVVGVVFRCRCSDDVPFLPLPLPLFSTPNFELELV